MKMWQAERKKHMKKFNVIDIIIVVALIAAICAGFLVAGGGESEDNAIKLITLEIPEKTEGFSENVVIGDKVTDKVEKNVLGVVTAVEVKPCEKNSYDRDNGGIVHTAIPMRENVYVTIETDADTEIEVGKSLSVITKHFAGAGYVVGVEYEGGAN